MMSEEDAAITRAQKRFMTSTWHLGEVSPDKPLHYAAWRVMYKGPQSIIRTNKIGVHGVFSQNAFLIPLVLPPMIVQYVSMRFLNLKWDAWFAGLVYTSYLFVMGARMTRHMGSLTLKHGFLDGGVPRDNIPDARVKSTVIFIQLTLTLRPLLACFLTYDRDELPHITSWLPIQMFAYVVVLDFWFYWYHRAMHEVDFLWKYHKTHHMTKHPTTLLAAFADPEQDICDILVIPLLTWLVLGINFFTWWICTIYVLYVEAAGHSGIRVQWRSPIPFSYPLLNWLGMDLELEDHDLHHRRGWKRSFNYGKQTRIWDTLFGTKGDRVEVVPGNLQ